MTKMFDHIGSPEARAFIVERLSDGALLGRSGYTTRQSTYALPYPPAQSAYTRDLVAAICAEDLPQPGRCRRAGEPLRHCAWVPRRSGHVGEGGERFEPDYALFLQKKETDGYEQMQIFRRVLTC